MREDDIEFYFEQVIEVYERGENATPARIREHIGPYVDRHLDELAEALAKLVERGRLEYKEVDHPDNVHAPETAYVPVNPG